MSNEDYIKEYPHLFKDDIDKWLFTECSIMGGACSSIESLRYSVARGIAEKLWRDDAPRKPIKVYRVENEAEEKGLWRKFDGTWEPLFDMLTDGKCKDPDIVKLYYMGACQWNLVPCIARVGRHGLPVHQARKPYRNGSVGET